MPLKRIFYCSDVETDLEALKAFRDFVASKADENDLTIINGDFISIESIFNREDAINYTTLLELMENTKRFFYHKLREKEIPQQLNEFFSKLNLALNTNNKDALKKARDNLNDVLKARDLAMVLEHYINLISEYKEFVKKAEENIKAQYQEIKEIMQGTKFLILPGNHDIKSIDDIFAEENLHKKVKDVEGISIAGYGSAELIPKILPFELVINYDERIENDKIHSEPYVFFKTEKPDIVVSHNPPAGYYPSLNIHALGLRQYILDEKPFLVLIGHIEDGKGVGRLDNSYIVNPGSLNSRGKKGSFAEINLNPDELSHDEIEIDKALDKVKFYLIEDYEIKEVGFYSINDGQVKWNSEDYAFSQIHVLKF